MPVLAMLTSLRVALAASLAELEVYSHRTLGRHGKSKDRRPGLKQIILGVVIDQARRADVLGDVAGQHHRSGSSEGIIGDRLKFALWLYGRMSTKANFGTCKRTAE